MASPLSVCLRLVGRRAVTASSSSSLSAVAPLGTLSTHGAFTRDFTTSTPTAGDTWGLFKLPESKKLKAAITYGGRYTVTLIPGDGIGPEMTTHVKEIFRLAGAPIDFETVEIDSQANYDAAVIAVRRNGVALKGNMTTDIDSPAMNRSKNVALRTELDLFADIVHCQTMPGIQLRHKNLDIVVIRENTEGEYSGIEHESVPGVIESLKVITRERSIRIAEFAFQFAHLNGRKKVTAVHKANIMKMGDGLFLECCKEVSKNYPNIAFEGMIVDNTSMQLVSKPQQFDVLVCPNLYGNIVSNIVCGLTGGAGLAPGVNIGDKYAVFETACRNTGSSMVGKNKANPVSMIKASTAMLNYLGLNKHATLIDECCTETLAQGIATTDLGGTATTNEFVQSMAALVKQRSAVVF